MNGELRELAQRASDQKVQADQTRPRAAGAALLSVCLGFFVIQLDATIVNVALPAIQREIGGSLAGSQWVVDAYTHGGSGEHDGLVGSCLAGCISWPVRGVSRDLGWAAEARLRCRCCPAG